MLKKLQGKFLKHFEDERFSTDILRLSGKKLQRNFRKMTTVLEIFLSNCKEIKRIL